MEQAGKAALIGVAMMLAIPAQADAPQTPQAPGFDDPADGCTDQGPLLDQTPSLESTSEWRLPISSTRPDVMTEARVQIRFARDAESGAWKAHLAFSFPDPKPLGIPFSFQKVAIGWMTNVGATGVVVDWSKGCSQPGRSLFPRQSFEADVNLDGTESTDALDHPTLRIWGSRN